MNSTVKKWMQWIKEEPASFKTHHTGHRSTGLGRAYYSLRATSNRAWKVKPQKGFIYITSFSFMFLLFFPLQAFPFQLNGDTLLSQRLLMGNIVFQCTSDRPVLACSLWPWKRLRFAWVPCGLLRNLFARDLSCRQFLRIVSNAVVHVSRRSQGLPRPNAYSFLTETNVF